MAHRNGAKKKQIQEEANFVQHFDPEHLSKELLSLGTPVITPEIANKIASSVQQKLQARNLQISPEIISELVGEELNQMQLFNAAQSSSNEDLLKVQTEKALPDPVEIPELKTPQAENLASHETPQLIPLNWKSDHLESLGKQFPFFDYAHKDVANLQEAIRSLCNQIAKNNTVASHSFYNLIAEQHFLPGSYFFHPDFLSQKKSRAYLEILAPQASNPFEVLETLYQLKQQGYQTLLNFPLDATAFNWELFLKLLEIRQEQERKEGQAQSAQFFRIELPNHLETSHEEKIHALLKTNNVSRLVYGDVTQDTLSSLASRFLKNSARLDLERLRTLPFETSSSDKELLNGYAIPNAYINLKSMIKEEEVDWDQLRKTTRLAVRFLDDVLDYWEYPNESFKTTSLQYRRLALGFIGFTDLLFILRIPFESEEAFCLASQISQLLEEEAVLASVQLAKEKGTYPAYETNNQSGSFPLRNAQLLMLCEDEFIAQLSHCSLGTKLYSHLVQDNSQFSNETAAHKNTWIHPFFNEVLKLRGLAHADLIEKIAKHPSLQSLEEIPEDLKKVFLVEEDVHWKNQLTLARQFEKHFENGMRNTLDVTQFDTEQLKELLSFCIDHNIENLNLVKTSPFSDQQIAVAALEKSIQKQEQLDLVAPLAPVLQLLPTLQDATSIELANTEATQLPPEQSSELTASQTLVEENLSKQTESHPQKILDGLLQNLQNLPDILEEDLDSVLDDKTELVQQIEVSTASNDSVILKTFDLPLDVVAGTPSQTSPTFSSPPLDVMTGFIESKPANTSSDFKTPVETTLDSLQENSFEADELTEIVAISNLPEDKADSPNDSEAFEDEDTVYMDNLQDFLEEDFENNPEQQNTNAFVSKTRPSHLSGKTYSYQTCCGKLWVTLNHDHEGIFEILTHLESNLRNCNSSQSTLINRLLSLLFQAQINTDEIIAQLSDLKCCDAHYSSHTSLSCFEAISLAIRSHNEALCDDFEDEETVVEPRWQTISESEWEMN